MGLELPRIGVRPFTAAHSRKPLRQPVESDEIIIARAGPHHGELLAFTSTSGTSSREL